MLCRRLNTRGNMFAVPLVTQRRLVNTEKVATGAASALVTSIATVGVFHLFVTPVTLNIAVITAAAAGASGALAALEGGKDEAGTTFGAVIGLFFGCIGGYFSKTTNEPWRK